MKNMLVMVGVGAVLFCVTVGGLLGSQDRLNYEGTKNIPLLRSLFTSPAQSEVVATRPSSKSDPVGPAASAPAAEMKPRRNSTGLESGMPEVRGFAPGEAFDLAKIVASGLGVDEINAMVEQTRKMKGELTRQRAELQQQRRDLEVRERDVLGRQARVAKSMQQVLDERARLERAIENFNQRVVELPIDEEAAFARISRTIAKLRPEAGAELLVEFWQTAGGQVKVVKILAVMDEDRADEILACLDTRRVREILEKRMTVIRTGKKKRRSR